MPGGAIVVDGLGENYSKVVTPVIINSGRTLVDADGQIVNVHYHKLIPMLLNELQKEHKHADEQDQTNRQQAEQIESLQAQARRFRRRWTWK